RFQSIALRLGGVRQDADDLGAADLDLQASQRITDFCIPPPRVVARNEEYISFLVGGTTCNVFFNEPFEVDGAEGPGPGSLYTDGGARRSRIRAHPGRPRSDAANASLQTFGRRADLRVVRRHGRASGIAR